MERSERRAGDGSPVGPPRLWTVREANARLSELEELLPRLSGWVHRLAEVREERERLASFWGAEADAEDQPDHELKARLDAEWHHLTQRLEEAVNALRAEGIEVKNLETGLIDFYGFQEGEIVFLCWQRGEPAVAFFHTLTGGYRSRRPIVPSETTPSPPARSSG